MREKPSESTISTLPATGPAGPIPHRGYCTPLCYKKGKLSKSCKCKRCRGDAHGRGWKYAFEHGYLTWSPLGDRKPPSDQEELFPDEPPTPIEEGAKPARPNLVLHQGTASESAPSDSERTCEPKRSRMGAATAAKRTPL